MAPVGIGRYVMFGLLAWCGACSSAPARPTGLPLRYGRDPALNQIVVAPEATLLEIAEALRAAGTQGASPWVAVLLGEPDPNHPLDSVRLRWGEGPALDLWRMREDQEEWYVREDPRAHNGAIAFWRDGRFFVTHPSDTSESAPLDVSAVADANRELGGSTREGVLILMTDETSVPARPILAEARRALQAVHYIMWHISPE